ncbi:uncharacterized protein TNCV_4270671 [Trichonephila clavipes]|nr:uncharacterized protein TNCV_4270671 [Trichonephila clavipes]
MPTSIKQLMTVNPPTSTTEWLMVATRLMKTQAPKPEQNTFRQNVPIRPRQNTFVPKNGKILGEPTAVFGAKNVSPKSAKLKVFKKASMTKNSWEAHASAGGEGEMKWAFRKDEIE